MARYQVGPGSHLAFPAIAYHLVIPATGYVALCHNLDVRCWHSGAIVEGVSRNLTHVGICYVGNQEPNLAQLAGIRAALRWVEENPGHPLESIEGHRDAPYPTACPGPAWPRWRPEILRYRT